MMFIKDMRLLIYTIANPLKQPQTGGDKRFTEFTKYACDELNADVCGLFSYNEAQNAGIKPTYQVKDYKKGLFSKLPPVISAIVLNWSLIKKIKKENYYRIVVFDVPIAFTLCLFRIRNIVLMIRKDLVGYEYYTSTHRKCMEGIYLSAKKIMETVCLINCRRIIVQCKYDEQQLLARHRMIRNRIKEKFFVQINNINPGWIDKKQICNDRRYSIDKESFNICFVGNFDNPRKGHDLLLMAARELSQKYNIMCFHIIGAGNDFEKYKREYVSNNIIFYGRIPFPGRVIEECDLMVVPSYADSCPNTVLESLYHGVPVVGSDRGGIPEILIDGDALFEMNVKSIVNIIEKLYNNRDLLDDISKKQKQRAEELTFDWNEKIMKIVLRE